jgi:hypothetical protein
VDVALWIVAGVLAAGFAASGAMKLVQPKSKLAAAGYGWVEDFSPGAVKAIGAAEVLGAIGLVLPPLVDVAPVLVPVAAVGLALVMAGALVVHQRRGEVNHFAAPAVLLVLAVFVAWGRFGPYSF